MTFLLNPFVLGGGVEASEISLSAAAYDSKTFDFSSEIAAASGVTCNADGTKIYINDGSDDQVHQYSLSTAGDLTTMSYDSLTKDFTIQEATSRSILLTNGGDSFFYSGNGSASVLQYSLGTTDAINTASYDSKSISGLSLPSIYGFKSDGTIIFYKDGGNVKASTLSTAFDISTVTSTVSNDIESVIDSGGGTAGTLSSGHISRAGKKGWFFDDSTIWEVDFSGAHDISTASYNGVSFSPVATPVANSDPYTFAVCEETNNFYIGGEDEILYQFSY